ncbi:two-component system, NtrC family, C4-dicarboxylate transport response regulator DctD [Monaibacterium marinum]|uniref:Nif-specific regulatory protein n=1 Tax=Pontivivens marinum TaxID=1690039 RepID=A0A2C9CL34_9RHOB|nr:sigma-54 dependent transcriptional regulator [Monaibacterium marinum]SOH92231.1 two-component system, NtrC family, C4-dicarboxylate transport response regulator DctD [Monaibacterium marinum]
MSERVILVDDEADVREAIAQSLELKGYDVLALPNAMRALEVISEDFEGCIISDIRMPRMDGLAFLDAIRERDAELPVILITGHGDVPLAVSALHAGAFDFIEKPFETDRLADAVARALGVRRLALENRVLRSELESRDWLESNLVGRAPVMTSLRQRLRTIAGSGADVLLLGETGSGKELAARAVHRLSDRSEKPFVAINMAALPETLIESELFGHEAGAFAGAHRARYGRFEHARGGTVFLDEIDALPVALQAKLLRVIEERSIERIGSNEAVPLDVRFVAASKANLSARVDGGEFRADLYYRLAVVTVEMPPLSARMEDVPRLFQHLVNQSALRHRRTPAPINGELFTLMAARDWPGNVRELRNAADRFVLGLDVLTSDTPRLAKNLPDRIEKFERAAIAAELTGQGGNVKATYEALGISRKTLYDKMQRHGLEREQFLNTGED